MYDIKSSKALYHNPITPSLPLPRAWRVEEAVRDRPRRRLRGADEKVTFLWRCNLRASLLRAGGLAGRYYVKITPFSPPPTSLTISIAPHLTRRPNLHLPRVRVRHVTFKYLTGLTFRRKLVSSDITLVVTRSLWSCVGNNGKSERVLGAICRSCYRCRRRWRRSGSWVDGVDEQGDVFPVHSQKYYLIRYRYEWQYYFRWCSGSGNTNWRSPVVTSFFSWQSW